MYISFWTLYTVFCIVFCTVCMLWPSKWICLHQIITSCAMGTHKLKYILYWADQSSQGRTKVSCTGMASPTNQPRKDPFHLYSLSSHPFTSVSTVSMGHPSMILLVFRSIEEEAQTWPLKFHLVGTLYVREKVPTWSDQARLSRVGTASISILPARTRLHSTWAGIFKKSIRARHRVGIGSSYRPARLHRLAELMPWNQFLGSMYSTPADLIHILSMLQKEFSTSHLLIYTYLLVVRSLILNSLFLSVRPTSFLHLLIILQGEK